ncbi:MAG: AMP-binding protein [Patescibacteria group bacterium]
MEKWANLQKMPLEKIQALQNKKLKRFVRHFVPYSPYYRELFIKNNLSFSDIQTTDDLVKLPFTTKEDLAPSDDDPGRPRKFMLQPDEELIKKYASKGALLKILWQKITKQDYKKALEWQFKPIHLHFTTGRTAKPTAFGYSAYDLENIKQAGERMFNVAGATRDMTSINGFPYSPHLAFWQAFFGFTQIGLTSLQTGGGKVMGTQKIIDAIESLKAKLVVFIPGYAYHLMREAASQQKDYSNIELVITGGEKLSPGFRDKIREFLQSMGSANPKILATYAMTEGKVGWIQCHEKSGYHLYPDIEYFELVNEEGQRVKEGEKGQIVYTALDWQSSMVLRYKTGDLTDNIETNPCPHCQRTVPRINPNIQRSSEFKEFKLAKVKGELVNLNLFMPLISGLAEVEEWQVEIKKKNNDPLELDEIYLYVSPRPGVNWESFKTKLEKLVYADIGVGVIIEQMDTQEILGRLGMETELKEKRLLDSRPQ